MNRGKFLAFFLYLISFSQLSFSQDFTEYNWYFGDSDFGIVFNKSDDEPNQVDNKQTPFGNGGAAVATDRISGNLLFYTDGNRVYDATHQLMAGWAALNGNVSANQPVSISPRPNSANQFYVFTNDANYPTPGTVSFSTINMNLPGNATPPAPNLGEVVNVNNPAALPDGITVNPGMLVFEVGNDPYTYFLLVQNAVTKDYHLYRIGGATNTLVTTVTNPTNLDAANFSLHPETGQIAVSPNNAGANVQILQLDSTNALSFDREIPNTGAFTGPGNVIYDVEFSNDGSKLFISRYGDTGQMGALYRYDLTDSLASLDPVNPDPLFRSFGLQKGPDGRIYHLYQENNGGPVRVGRVASPDSALVDVMYQTIPLGNDNFNSMQFSAYAPPATVDFDPAGFEYFGECNTNATHFYPDLDPPAESYTWDFGDPMSPDNTSNQITPNHTYSEPGSYQVSLTASINGKDTVMFRTVNIMEGDTIDLGQDTVICPNESLILDVPCPSQTSACTYRWSNGETGQSITVDSSNAPGYFWVVVDPNDGGCPSYDGINIEVYGVDLQVANYWYFGDNAGIDFNEQPPVAVSDGQLNTPEGASGISDRNGENLLYTDGNIVYDQMHVQMTDGIDIGGDNGATQSSLVVPFPNDETQFYIFTTEQVFNSNQDYRLQYSVVDIKEIGGGTVGSVITKEKPLFETSTERITATNPGGFVWLIAHEQGTNTFRAYPVSDFGIGPPVLTSIGSIHDANNAGESRGYMKLSTDGSRLAVGLTKDGMNYVEIFDFDPMTGELSNYLQISVPDDYPQVYGVEFSNDGEKLFVTTNSKTTDVTGASGSKLYELRLFNYDKDSIEQYTFELAEESGINMGAIQTGPDGQVYVAREGQQMLGTIIVNDDSLTSSTYNEMGFDLMTGTSTLGLPNFIQSIFQQTPDATAQVIPACITQPSTFIGTGTSIIDEFLWTFGDGGSATTDSATHVYVTDSLYTVSFNVSNRCGLDTTITQQVDISGFPDDATIDPVEVLCDGPLVLDADTTNAGDKTFIWSTGATTQQITVTSPGIFSVRTINAAGCESEDTTQVFDGRPPVDLGPNITVCQDDSIVLDTGLPVGNPANTFTWFRDGNNLNSNTNVLTVDTSTPGVFEYVVNAVDGLSLCVGDDTVQITINPSPTATLDVINATCGASDGEVTVTSVTTDLTFDLQDQTGSSVGGPGPPFTALAAGSYTMIVTDNITQCVQDIAVSLINDPSGFTITPGTPVDKCGGSDIDITIEHATDLFNGGSYTLTNQSTQQVVRNENITTGIGTNPVTFLIDSLAAGTYTILIDAFNCTDSSSFTINQLPSFDLTVQPSFDVCSSDPIISATATPAPDLYEWTGPNGFSATGQSIDVSNAGSGQYTVTVRNLSGIPCDTTAVTQVNLSDSPEPVINPLTDGCDGTRQLAVGNLGGGNYSYVWGTVPPGGFSSAAPSVTVTNTANYVVTVRDQFSGCQGSDTSQIVVSEPLFVAVTVDQQACDDGNLVTLTANVIPPVQDVTYRWFLNDVELRDTDQNLETFNEGLYRAVVTDVTGLCTNSGELEINRAPVTPSDIEPTYVICPEPPADEVAVIEPGNFVTYLGFNLETGDQIFTTMPGVFEVTEEGTYGFILENEFNCITNDTTFVNVDCVPTIFAPNAFSPMAEIPDNQTFKIYPTFVTDFEIYIYNRWGELVYYSNDLAFMTDVGWDGVMNGKQLPFGTYAYLIKFKSVTEPDRGIFSKRGGVTLVR